MKFTRSVIAFLHQGDFLASVDIKDAYLHLPNTAVFPTSWCGASTLPVHGRALSLILFSLDIHQILTRVLAQPCSCDTPHCGILGQLAVEGSVPVGFVEQCGSDYPDFAEVQMDSEPSEISAGTNSSFGESGLVLDTSQGTSLL